MKKLLVVPVLIFATACGVKNKETAKVTEQPNEDIAAVSETLDEIYEEEVEVEAVRSVYHGSETILTDLVHTKLEINFNWEKSQLNGVATITAKPHFYPTSELVLDAKGMDINSVKQNGKDLEFTYKDDFLTIQLDKEYTRKDKYDVVIDYVAKPDEREAGGSDAITSDKGLYFINPKGEDPNKMPQIWTQGETESSSVWFPTIDAPNAKTSQEVIITVDDKYKTLSNGKLLSSKKIGGGKRVDHWLQELPHAPYLFMLGVGEFAVVEDSYTRPDGTKMAVNYYVEPEWEEFADDIFDETPEMIRYFSELLGVEYPWDKYHQIVVRDYVSGAMENTGAVIFGDYVYKSDRDLLDANDQSTIAHELFHHWFGDLVTCESWSNLTLNESFANYSQYLWDEHRYGLDEADYQAEIEADGYYRSAQMSGYHDLVWFDYPNKDDMFDGHSYNKGGRILHMLRNYLGDDAFFTAISKYLNDNKYKAAEFHHLRLAFEDVCGEDLNWFFNQWYLGSGHPIMKFDQEVDEASKTVNIKVTQSQNTDDWPLFKVPTTMVVMDDKGSHDYKVVIDSVEQTFSFPYSGEVKGILYDKDQVLLAKTNKDKTTAQYIYQYYHGEKYRARREGLLKGSRDRGEAGQKLILDAMNDKFWHIRQLAVKKVTSLKNENKDKGLELLKEIVANDPSSAVRSEAIKTLKKLLDDKELITISEDRIQKDSSYSVVTNALMLLGSIDSEKALTQASILEKENSSMMLYGVSALYGREGDVSKYDFFIDVLSSNKVQGYDQIGVFNAFTEFVGRHGLEVGEKAFDYYKEVEKSGNFYLNYFLGQNVNYLKGKFAALEKELNDELSKHEENNDAAYADQTRKKIEKITSVRQKYDAFAKYLEE